MPLFHSILVVAIFSLLGSFQTASAGVVLTKDAKAQIEHQLDKVANDYGVVGQSLAILKNGALVHTSARGSASVELDVTATDQTVYQVFSLAKLFVNVTMMQMAQAGSIELDAPISRYVEELPKAWRDVTVRQAMSHMTGLPDCYRWPVPTPETAQAAIQSVAYKAPEFEAGSKTRYNQTNYLLLKMIIENVEHEQFVQVMTTRMIDKLNLANTSYGGEYAVIAGRATTYRSANGRLARNVHIDQPDYMFASSGLNTNVLDMANWFSALLDHRFLSEEMMEAMWTPVRLNDGAAANFANGWEFSTKNGVTVVGHGGGNRADVRHFFEPGGSESITVIYFTNGSVKNFWPGSVSQRLAEIIRNNE